MVFILMTFAVTEKGKRMIKEFVQAWDKNKNKLEEYFRTTKQEEYDEYEKIVKRLFDVVINPEIDEGGYTSIFGFSYKFDTDKILVIDDGEYQGTQIFILHKKSYQPNVKEYVYTNAYYGSCTVCDTLQAIHCYDDGFPTQQQVKDYMTLRLHLLQKCHYMKDE